MEVLFFFAYFSGLCSNIPAKYGQTYGRLQDISDIFIYWILKFPLTQVVPLAGLASTSRRGARVLRVALDDDDAGGSKRTGAGRMEVGWWVGWLVGWLVGDFLYISMLQNCFFVINIL